MDKSASKKAVAFSETRESRQTVTPVNTDIASLGNALALLSSACCNVHGVADATCSLAALPRRFALRGISEYEASGPFQCKDYSELYEYFARNSSGPSDNSIIK